MSGLSTTEDSCISIDRRNSSICTKYWIVYTIHLNLNALVNLSKTLLDDPAYPLSPWLMKIYGGNNLSQMQERFNRELCGIRQIIELCIGLLKVRLRCILGERQLRYSPTKVGRIIYSCATLHNFLIFNRFNIMRDIDEDLLANVINDQIDPNFVNLLQANLRSGQIRRNEVANSL